mmetsp:Transcript_84372/g.131765  ORF Transcript_84372/g.131765 Transcript_84372/m.131765 type:complete len:569 (+) Transcript_84372:70-1776(+)
MPVGCFRQACSELTSAGYTFQTYPLWQQEQHCGRKALSSAFTDQAVREAHAKAKQGKKELLALEPLASSQRALIADAEDQLSSTETRMHIQEAKEDIVSSMPVAEPFDNFLRRLSVGIQSLYKDIRGGVPNGVPFQERADLQSISQTADEASQYIGRALTPAKAAVKQMQAVLSSIESSKPALVKEDAVLKNKLNEDPHQMDGEVSETEAWTKPTTTSHGCVCDPMSPCGKNGQPFNWCIVSDKTDPAGGGCDFGFETTAATPAGGKELVMMLDPKKMDPLGATHKLLDDPSKMGHAIGENAESSTKGGTTPPPEKKPGEDLTDHERFIQKMGGRDEFFWDYCVPPEAQELEQPIHPDTTKTVHDNCRCQERWDILNKYLSDRSVIDKDDGIPYPDQIPFSHRITVEAMLQKKADSEAALCSNTVPSAHGFYVCPVAPDCVGLKRVGDGTMSKTGMLPSSSWFNGAGARSWDFCTPTAGPEHVKAHTANLKARYAHMQAFAKAHGLPVHAIEHEILTSQVPESYVWLLPAAYHETKLAASKGSKQRIRSYTDRKIRHFLPTLAKDVVL